MKSNQEIIEEFEEKFPVLKEIFRNIEGMEVDLMTRVKSWLLKVLEEKDLAWQEIIKRRKWQDENPNNLI